MALQSVKLKKLQIMSKGKKCVCTGIIGKDTDGNYFCDEYLLDYQYTLSKIYI
jgi:hypothetical protein